ncbi:MAG: IgGFc-binding protein [Sphingobacteriales bacterium]|nr:IgGFc-binding protein [Sphingobacteriales bacterium]
MPPLFTQPQPWGKDYYAMGFESLSGWTGYPSYLVVVGTQNNTEVEITPSSATTTGQPANTPFSITLDQGQTYLLQSDTDLTARGCAVIRPTTALVLPLWPEQNALTWAAVQLATTCLNKCHLPQPGALALLPYPTKPAKTT